MSNIEPNVGTGTIAFGSREVLAAMRSPPPVLSVNNTMFGATWMQSHVRLVELVPSVATTYPVLLAHCLMCNPKLALGPEEWLPNVDFLNATAGSLHEYLKRALDEFQEPDHETNLSLVEALHDFDGLQCSNVVTVKPSQPIRTPYGPLSGPTYQMAWTVTDRFFFLEIHCES